MAATGYTFTEQDIYDIAKVVEHEAGAKGRGKSGKTSAEQFATMGSAIVETIASRMTEHGRFGSKDKSVQGLVSAPGQFTGFSLSKSPMPAQETIDVVANAVGNLAKGHMGPVAFEGLGFYASPHDKAYTGYTTPSGGKMKGAPGYVDTAMASGFPVFGNQKAGHSHVHFSKNDETFAVPAGYFSMDDTVAAMAEGALHSAGVRAANAGYYSIPEVATPYAQSTSVFDTVAPNVGPVDSFRDMMGFANSFGVPGPVTPSPATIDQMMDVAKMGVEPTPQDVSGRIGQTFDAVPNVDMSALAAPATGAGYPASHDYAAALAGPPTAPPGLDQGMVDTARASGQGIAAAPSPFGRPGFSPVPTTSITVADQTAPAPTPSPSAGLAPAPGLGPMPDTSIFDPASAVPTVSPFDSTAQAVGVADNAHTATPTGSMFDAITPAPTNLSPMASLEQMMDIATTANPGLIGATDVAPAAPAPSPTPATTAAPAPTPVITPTPATTTPAPGVKAPSTPSMPAMPGVSVVPGAIPAVADTVRSLGLQPNPQGVSYGYSPVGPGVAAVYDTAPDHVKTAATGPGLFGALAGATGMNITPPGLSGVGRTAGGLMGGLAGGLLGGIAGKFGEKAATRDLYGTFGTLGKPAYDSFMNAPAPAPTGPGFFGSLFGGFGGVGTGQNSPAPPGYGAGDGVDHSGQFDNSFDDSIGEI